MFQVTLSQVLRLAINAPILKQATESNLSIYDHNEPTKWF